MKKIFKLLLFILAVVVIVLVVGVSVWWQRQYWTYHYNFRIEKVTMKEIVLDSITDWAYDDREIVGIITLTVNSL